jgi:hypothetical protein
MFVLAVDTLLGGGTHDLVDIRRAFVHHDQIACDKQGISK